MDQPDPAQKQSEHPQSPAETEVSNPPRAAVSVEAPNVPDYELLRRIGGGAYGEVWLARNQATKVLRAAKIVWRHTFEDERPFQREFEGIQKFERISREHPSQLALFHIGRNQAEGYFYYVMELADRVEAQSLNSKVQSSPLDSSSASGSLETYTPHTLRAELAQGRLPAARVLEIGLALTEALGHLHEKGLVHRDVKPSNVIFVNGRPKLADIGLVTDASDQCSIVGTEGYLPPEGPGTPQADIFALGKVLYEAVTGLDRRQFADLPAQLKEWPDSGLVLELNQVVLRACAKDVGERYAGAEPMRRDLALLVDGKSVHRAHRREQRWRLARRFGAWAVAGAVALSLVVLAIRQATTAGYVEKLSTNALANSYFAFGKTHFDRFRGTNFQVASDYFEKAIREDTNFALAYGYLAATYFWADDGWNPGWQLLPKAKDVAEKALKLDDRLAEPYLALGWYYGMGEWKWKEALKQDKRAVEFNSSSAICHLCYAELLRMAGKTNEAFTEISKAKNLDQNSPIINVRLVHYLTCVGRFNDALTQIENARIMEAWPNAVQVAWERRDLYLALGEADKAIEAERDGRIADGQPRAEVEQDTAAKMRSPPAERAALLWRGRLDWDKKQGDAELYDQACCHAQLREYDEALECLSTLRDRHDTGLTFMIMTDWELDPLRSDRRFHDILKKMHFE
jgi:serine/threonine protein kinase